MNIKKLLSILWIAGTVFSFNSTQASTEVLVFNEDGFPLIMENGVATRPENAVVNARIFVAQELRRLWAGVNPFPEQFIQQIARTSEDRRPSLITASDISVRDYPGINQRVYDRQRRIAVPGYRPPITPRRPRAAPPAPERGPGYYAEKDRRAQERAARLAERNATAAHAPMPRERSFLNRLFGGTKDYEVDESALAEAAEAAEQANAAHQERKKAAIKLGMDKRMKALKAKWKRRRIAESIDRRQRELRKKWAERRSTQARDDAEALALAEEAIAERNFEGYMSAMIASRDARQARDDEMLETYLTVQTRIREGRDFENYRRAKDEWVRSNGTQGNWYYRMLIDLEPRFGALVKPEIEALRKNHSSVRL